MCCCTYRASAFVHQTISWRHRGHGKSELAVIFLSGTVRTATLARLSVTSSSRTLPESNLAPRTVSKWIAAFSLLSRCATCCFALLRPLFAKARLMEQTLASPDRLSLTSIKPNKAWAQAVRSQNIHSLDTQRCQPSALSNINRSAIGARIVVDCTQGVVKKAVICCREMEEREVGGGIFSRGQITQKRTKEDHW